MIQATNPIHQALARAKARGWDPASELHGLNVAEAFGLVIEISAAQMGHCRVLPSAECVVSELRALGEEAPKTRAQVPTLIELVEASRPESDSLRVLVLVFEGEYAMDCAAGVLQVRGILPLSVLEQ